MNTIKKGLGRGLSALFGDSSPRENAKVTSKVNVVGIADLSRNPYQCKIGDIGREFKRAIEPVE